MSLRNSLSPHSTLGSRSCGEHITTDDVARSFAVLYALHAKIPNYSTTSERSSCKDSPSVINGLVFGRATMGSHESAEGSTDHLVWEWSVVKRLVRTDVVTQAHYGPPTATNDDGPR